MVEIDRIDKQLEKFDVRLSQNEKCSQDTNLKLERNNVLTEQNTLTMEKFSQTLEDTSNTMREISYVIKQMVQSQNDMEQSIEDINKRIDTQEDKGKFDFIQYIKDNFPVVCLTIFYVLDKVGVL